MNAIRKILMPLLLIPLGMFIYVLFHPDWQWDSPGLESLFLVIGIPILIVNFIAWFYPEIIRAYFPVKEEWGKERSQPVTFAVVISALIAFMCISVGMISSMPTATARPTYKPPATAFEFTPSNQMYSDHPDSGENDVAIPQLLPATNISPGQARQSPTAENIPEPTPQIPVSGGAPTLLVTQTRIASASIPSTSSTNLSAQPTSTANPSALCTPANSDYLNVVSQSVQDWDSDNEVSKVWMVQSKAAANLWFMAAKITGPQVDANAPPGVWGLFVDSAGIFDLYAVNDTAMNFSGAGWGEDSDPVITMQSDGAQAAYNCAVAR